MSPLSLFPEPGQLYAYAGTQLLKDLEALKAQTASHAQQKRILAWIQAQARPVLFQAGPVQRPGRKD